MPSLVPGLTYQLQMSTCVIWFSPEFSSSFFTSGTCSAPAISPGVMIWQALGSGFGGAACDGGDCAEDAVSRLPPDGAHATMTPARDTTISLCMAPRACACRRLVVNTAYDGARCPTTTPSSRWPPPASASAPPAHAR